MGGQGAEASHALRGPIDRAVLIAIRDVFEESEPLAAPALDDFLDPRVLEVRLQDGLRDAGSARIDVQWTTRGDYSFHYTDSENRDFRWDKHPHSGVYAAASGPEHFHPPPAASTEPRDVEASCIGQASPTLVTRAVMKLWRAAYHADSLSPLNAGQNPP